MGAYVTARTTDFNMTGKETPADGVVTGYIRDFLCVHLAHGAAHNGSILAVHIHKVPVYVSSAIADFTFMEEKKAKLFVNAPNAIDGNYAAKCDTSSAAFLKQEC